MQKSGFLSLFFRFFRVNIPYLDKLFLSLMVSILSQIIILLPPLFVKVIFDYAYIYQDLNILIIFSLFSFLLGFFILLFNILNSFLNLYLDQEVSQIFYDLLYSKFQVLPMRFYKNYETGDLIYRMTKDVEDTIDTTVNATKLGIATILKLVVLLVIAFSMNATLTCLALVGIPFQFLQTHYFSKKLQVINKKNKETSADMYAIIIERIANIKLIKMFAQGKKEVNRFILKVKELFQIEKANLLFSNANTFCNSNLYAVWSLVLGIYTGYLVITGSLTIGQAVAIGTYIALLNDPFDTLAMLYQKFLTSVVAFRRIAEVLDYSEEETATGIKPENIQGKIILNEVSFGYTDEKLIIDNLSLIIESKSSCAFVGRSGIGKSSLIDVLLRFYPLNSGTIFLDSYNIYELDLNFLRKNVALIPQEVVLLEGSIKENIIFGLEEEVPMEVIISAAKKANAHEFIMSLPNGYDTHYGNKGISLSGGQRQRIAIARAIIMKPKVLIFDEATSALDSESEKYIQAVIENLQKEITVIIVAHRLSTVKHVDNIYVLGTDAKILEQGSYSSLLKKRGFFYRLHEMQFGGFQEFLTQLDILAKTASRYKRDITLAKIQLTNFNELEKVCSEQELVHYMEELVINLAQNIREVDLISYQLNGTIWVVFPETSTAGAEVALERMKNMSILHKYPEPLNQKINIEFEFKNIEELK